MKNIISKKHIPLAATIFVSIVLYISACFKLDGFFSVQVFINFFSDNSFLGLAAIGMTFVIISGGIDLSVGAVIGCSGIMIAELMNKTGIHPTACFLIVMIFGTLFGTMMGVVIHYFKQPPFLITLAGMFLARGIGFIINMESQSIQHPFFDNIQNLSIPFFYESNIPASAVVLLIMFVFAFILSGYTRFGRNVYAIGGNENSAVLMGLPVASVKILVYSLSGFCSALAGIVYSVYTFSGNPTAGTMLELDSIAAVVIGGTLLTGGVGSVVGTMFGVLIFGIIQTAIIFDGTLSSWWTKIAVGALLLIFILLQRIIRKKF